MTMKFNLESFCPEPWSQLEISPEGEFKICCLANYDDDFGMAVDKDGKIMNIMENTFEEAINSEVHKQHRLELSQNIKVKRCRNCYDSEDSTREIAEWGSRSKTGISKRQRVLKNTAKTYPEYTNVNTAADEINEDGSIINPKIINLDIRFGNLCNQKCIMCSPRHSNQWYDDWEAIYGITPRGKILTSNFKREHYKTFYLKDENGTTTLPWWETDVWWDKFEKISPQLRHIYFTGGEPLIVPAMQECLDRLIKNGYAENMQLRYDTNLSVINNKVIDKWKHFKKVYLCVSLDEVGDRYNFIRFPGNYQKIIENINHLKTNGIEIHYISSCIGTATPYALERLLPLSAELEVDLNIRYLEGPKHLDIRIYPKSAKLEIIERLKKLNSNPLWNRWIQSQINLLTKYLDFEDQSRIQEFVRVMDILDGRRGTSWRNTLSDVSDLIDRHCRL